MHLAALLFVSFVLAFTFGIEPSTIPHNIGAELGKAVLAHCQPLSVSDQQNDCIQKETTILHMKNEISWSINEKHETTAIRRIPDLDTKRISYLFEKYGYGEEYRQLKAAGRTTVQEIEVLQSPRHLHADSSRIWFNSSGLQKANELIMEIDPSQWCKTEKDAYQLNIYEYVTPHEVSVDPVLTHVERNGVGKMPKKEIQMPKVLHKIKTRNHSNYGFLLRAKCQGFGDASSHFEHHVDIDFKTIHMHASFGHNVFKKRSSNEVQCLYPNRNGCCRSHSQVPFSEFHWNWVLAPQFLDVGMCVGTRADGTKCSPNQLEDLEMIIVTKTGDVELKVVPSLIVASCS